jgi:hypothetical protein
MLTATMRDSTLAAAVVGRWRRVVVTTRDKNEPISNGCVFRFARTGLRAPQPTNRRAHNIARVVNVADVHTQRRTRTTHERAALA